jgi:hypothetical protein
LQIFIFILGLSLRRMEVVAAAIDDDDELDTFGGKLGV